MKKNTMPITKELSSEMRAEREKLGLTYSQAARGAGLSTTSVKNLELRTYNNVNVAKVEKLNAFYKKVAAGEPIDQLVPKVIPKTKKQKENSKLPNRGFAKWFNTAFKASGLTHSRFMKETRMSSSTLHRFRTGANGTSAELREKIKTFFTNKYPAAAAVADGRRPPPEPKKVSKRKARKKAIIEATPRVRAVEHHGDAHIKLPTSLELDLRELELIQRLRSSLGTTQPGGINGVRARLS